jgi:hypothetical protein
MLRTCRAADCSTLTLGSFCLVHEPPRAPRRYPRGRPYRPQHAEVAAVAEIGDPARKKHGSGVVLMEGAG